MDLGYQDVSGAGGSAPLTSIMSLLRYIAQRYLWGLWELDLLSWHLVQIKFNWTSLLHCEQAKNDGRFALDHFRTVVLVKPSRHEEPPFSYVFQERDGMIKRLKLPKAMAGGDDLLTNKFWGQLKAWGCIFLWKCLFMTLQYCLILSVGLCSTSAAQEAGTIFKSIFWTFLLYRLQKNTGAWTFSLCFPGVTILRKATVLFIGAVFDRIIVSSFISSDSRGWCIT